MAQIAETFRHATPDNAAAWTFYDNACLTVDGGANSCAATAQNPLNYQDTDGQGWLRLTAATQPPVDQSKWQNGRALFGTPFPLASGFDLVFTYAMYGGSGTPADGISVFLFDAAQSGTGGAAGGALGYCQTGGAIIGIGLDAYGNFPNPGNYTIRDYCGSLAFPATGPGQRRSNISVRAGAAASHPWDYLTGTGVIPSSTLRTDPGWSYTAGTCASAGCQRQGKQIHMSFYPDSTCGANEYRILVESITKDPITGTTVTASMANLCVAQTRLGALPANVKLGFAASTGTQYQYHEIRDITVSHVADLSITKYYGKAEYQAGESSFYTIVVSNNGPSGIADAVLTDPQVTGLTVNSVTCAVPTGSTAVCPASPISVADLQAAGLVIPTLPAGSSLTFTLNTTVATGMTGNLVNQASIQPPPGSPVANSGVSCTADGSEYDTATDTCTAVSTTPQTGSPIDISITKQYGSATYAPGETGAYTIVISNHGTADVDDAVLIDPLAIGLSVSGGITCALHSGHAACPSPASMTETALRGTPGIVIPKLAPGSSLAFTVTVKVDAGMTGSLINIATLRPPAGETNTGNSCAGPGITFNPVTGICSATTTTPPRATEAAATPVPTLGDNVRLLLSLTLLGLGAAALLRRNQG